MKIKNNLSGVGRVTSTSTTRSSDSSSDSGSSADVSSDGVSISEDMSLIQALRNAAKGEEPIRSELIEQARRDIADGKLGTKEDYEQVITALLQEL